MIKDESNDPDIVKDQVTKRKLHDKLEEKPKMHQPN